jgi:hypothetical protein
LVLLLLLLVLGTTIYCWVLAIAGIWYLVLSGIWYYVLLLLPPTTTTTYYYYYYYYEENEQIKKKKRCDKIECLRHDVVLILILRETSEIATTMVWLLMSAVVVCWGGVVVGRLLGARW